MFNMLEKDIPRDLRSKRIILREIGYTSTYCAPNVLLSGQYDLDRITPSTTTTPIGIHRSADRALIAIVGEYDFVHTSGAHVRRCWTVRTIYRPSSTGLKMRAEHTSRATVGARPVNAPTAFRNWRPE